VDPSILQKKGKTIIGKTNQKLVIVFEENKIHCPENEEVATFNQCKDVDKD